ncbi:MAG: M64 family metallopeptidase [Hyphomicrobiaceae bacterium]
MTATLTTIQQTGDSANRIDMVFIGDGYTADDLALGTFSSHVSGYLNYIFGGSALSDPFTAYRNFFNIHMVEVASNESGADIPGSGIYVDTALDASFSWGGGPERLLYFSSTLANAAIAEAFAGTGIAAEMRYGVVNTTKYGGGGGSYGVYAGGNGSSHEVALHEIGHSFAHLADEYNYGGPETHANSEPSAANVTIDASGAKWANWLGFVDPILGVVGAYEGGHYSKLGVYRPTLNSKMNSLGRPFDPIAKEAFIREFYKYVDPLDGHDDNSGTRYNLHTLAVDTIDPSIVSVDWTVDGDIHVDAGESFDFDDAGLTFGIYEVTARAYDPTEWVRGDRSDLEESVSWTVENDYLLRGTGAGEVLTGTDNAQVIRAGAGSDTVRGLAGDDTIWGDSGNDRIHGGDGNDVIRPGTGRDFMTGGSGRDVFDFDSRAEIGRGAARDRITDFRVRVDDIDLRTIDASTKKAGNNAFKFIGQGAFHKHAGELHYVKLNGPGTSHDRTLVEGDVNGDGRADFQIELTGLKSLGAHDFLL